MILLLLLACATPQAPSAGLPGAVFPHPEGYALPSAHGADAIQQPGACALCHTRHATETTSPDGPPPCEECHPDYPHPEGFYFGAEHGPAWSESCTGCHGEAGDHLPAGVAEGACVSCHSTYPHPPGWERVDHHGEAAMARGGSPACTSCHTDPSPCQSCHPDYPHPEDMGITHGDLYQVGSCTGACHDGATTLPDEVRCASCHDGMPHPWDWASPSRHAPVVQARGTASCLVCHREGMDGPELPVSCAPACHGPR